MIVHVSFSHSCFPQKSAGSFKFVAISPSRGSAAASEIRVYIQDDNKHKENIEDQDNIEKISSEESVNSQELEETPQKKKLITKCSSGKKGNAARWSNDLIFLLIDEYEARPCLWDIFSNDYHNRDVTGNVKQEVELRLHSQITICFSHASHPLMHNL